MDVENRLDLIAVHAERAGRDKNSDNDTSVAVHYSKGLDQNHTMKFGDDGFAVEAGGFGVSSADKDKDLDRELVFKTPYFSYGTEKPAAEWLVKTAAPSIPVVGPVIAAGDTMLNVAGLGDYSPSAVVDDGLDFIEEDVLGYEHRLGDVMTDAFMTEKYGTDLWQLPYYAEKGMGAIKAVKDNMERSEYRVAMEEEFGEDWWLQEGEERFRSGEIGEDEILALREQHELVREQHELVDSVREQFRTPTFGDLLGDAETVADSP